MTQAQLNRLVRKWKKKLRLVGWDSIEFVFKPEEEMTEKELGLTLGWCEWSTADRRAWGAIMEEEALVQFEGNPNVEETLVHELLHLVFQGHLDKLPKSDPHFERALNDVARLLVPEKKNVKETTKRQRST